ncbi:MAG: hypothetical protein H7A55_09345 [Verrucomicrobiaceae bacterium]|nr:hypothetical protein [Verrucomicrobiaceae bacterium]
MNPPRRLSALLAIVCAASLAHAEKDAALQPVLAKAGAATAEDSFAAAELGKSWAIAKGTWVIKDGALAGSFKEEDHHPAVLTLAVPHRDSIIRFSFKLEGEKGFALSYNFAKGHLFRIGVDAEGLVVTKDRDKKNKESKAIEMATAGGKIAPGEWHTMLVETKGGKVSVQIDETLKAAAENAGLDVDKTGYRFVTAGSVVIDDVKAWQAE